MATIRRALPVLLTAQAATCRARLPRVCIAGFHETPTSFAASGGKKDGDVHLDYYKILGVKPSASHHDIKEAFRELGAYHGVRT